MVHEPPTYEFVSTAMSTTVSVQIVGAHPNAEALAADALDWFRIVESTCSRFDTSSDLARLCAATGVWTPVTPLLFEVLRVALAVAEASDGAFDPTLGAALHTMGFDTHWQTGARLAPRSFDEPAHWRDVQLDDERRRVWLARPLMLDLGAVAKGFALDLAARAMAGVAHCCIVAGGDLVYRGANALGRPWRTAIVDPLSPERSAAVVEVNAPEYAVCTSGGYRRVTAQGHHLLTPLQQANSTGVTGVTGVAQAHALASVTVIAPQAAIADPLSTAVFVLGAERGAALLESQGVDGLLIGADGAQFEVRGWARSHFSAAQG
jgi:thiamine biosynthesis lipoprotein